MPRLKLEGILVPHVTPFTSKGRLDMDALRTCLTFWLKSGVSGLVPCGSNGEAPYLSQRERKKVIETTLEIANGKVPVVAGTGSMSTAETIAFTKDAKDLGADAALVVTPFYFRLSNREIHEHYRAVIESVDLPIVIYNVPKFTGYSLEPSLIARLVSEHDNIVAVKDSSGDSEMMTEIIRLVGNKISVLAGAADLILQTLMQGGKGAIIAIANVFPELCTKLYKHFKEGKNDDAVKLQQTVSYVNEVLVKKHNQLAAIKQGLKMRGLPAGYPRKPALPLESEERENIEKLLKEIKKLG